MICSFFNFFFNVVDLEVVMLGACRKSDVSLVTSQRETKGGLYDIVGL